MADAGLDGDSVFKVVVMGAGGVGKSAITIRFINGQFLEEYDPTIEDSYHKKSEVDLGNSQKQAIVFSILDTAGQDEYKALQETWVRESEYFLLVYAIDSQQTFEQINEFIKIIARAHEVNEEPLFISLVGNKCDMRNASNEDKFVKTEDGKDLCQRIHMLMAEARGIDASDPQIGQQLDHMVRRRFLETSAKTGTNITEAFHDIVRMKKQYEHDAKNIQQTANSNGGGCCLLL